MAAADRDGWRDCVEGLCAAWHEEDRQQVIILNTDKKLHQLNILSQSCYTLIQLY